MTSTQLAPTFAAKLGVLHRHDDSKDGLSKDWTDGAEMTNKQIWTLLQVTLQIGVVAPVMTCRVVYTKDISLWDALEPRYDYLCEFTVFASETVYCY